MLDIDLLLKELTLEEKISLLSGHKSWHSNKISRLNIPSIFITDGPHGLRKKKENSKSIGLGEALVSTCFPTAATTGNSWNVDGLYRMGKAMGEECRGYDVNVLLGPAVNIKRNPLCGRNFEYFSEDPLLTGRLGSSLTKGIEELGVATSVKHFACNNQEANRYVGDSIVDDRALYEIYLKGFEIIVKEGKPQTVMCAYNKVNGEFASENKRLLTDILRDDWKFDGVVMSDWGAVNDRVKGLMAGLDLEMPGDIGHNRQVILDAVNNGKLGIEVVNNAVKNVLNLINNTYDKSNIDPNLDEHDELAYDLSVESAVLLKNEDNILPFKTNEKYFIVGDLFENMRYQGAGSSLINPYKLVTPKKYFDEQNINYEFVRGYDANSLDVDYKLKEEAIKKASNYDTIVFFGGLSDYAESEGFDREHMRIPLNQEVLITEFAQMNKKIVFVFYGGSPIEIPCYDSINAMLAMYLPGQAGGKSTYDLLFGNVSPSGRLAESWPKEISDVAFSNEFTLTSNDLYKESIFVGYRYYESFDIHTRFPFGYGLSYTKFSYKDFVVQDFDDKFIVKVLVTNEGAMRAKDVIEIFVGGPNGSIVRPKRELKGFAKVELSPNESKIVEIIIKKDDLRIYIDQKWILEQGSYEFMLCKNANEVIDSVTVFIKSLDSYKIDELYNSIYNDYAKFITISEEQMSKLLNREFADPNFYKPYTLNTPLKEYKTFGGKMIFNAIMFACKIILKKAKKSKGLDREYKIKNAYFMYKLMPFLSIRAMSYTSEGLLSHRRALGILDIANNHFFKGIWKLISKEKVFKLPN